MDVIQDCIRTLQGIKQQFRLSLQNNAEWQAAQEEVAVCGCGNDTCQLGDNGCKPQTHLITEKEIS